MLKTASLSEQIEETLKEQILLGNLGPGERIPVDELAEQWGVSSTPIRDALRRLESVGSASVAPRRGFYVETLTKEEFKNIFDLRIVLEALAVETATTRIPEEELARVMQQYQDADAQLSQSGERTLLLQYDHALHTLIIQYCDNPKLREFMDELRVLDLWARGTLVSLLPDAYERALPEHIQVMKALQTRDPKAARAALVNHLENALQRAYVSWNGRGAPPDEKESALPTRIPTKSRS